MPTVDAERLVALPAAREHQEALLRFFREAGCACHCRYWHFAGDKNAWQDRLAHAPEENRREFSEALASHDAPSPGVIARLGDSVVGWIKVEPWAGMQKLAAARPYRGMPALLHGRGDVYVIGCALVHPRFRRQGVLRALLPEAEALARARGARVLEAFPRDATGLGDEELWMGPMAALLERGFREIDRIGPYPVLAKALC